MQAYPQEILTFLEQHQATPAAQLALTKFVFSDFTKQELLQQLVGRQKGFRKFPFLAKYPQYKFPASISIEQASSETTAKFKASIIQGNSLADLTAGMGMDTYWLGKKFKAVHYVEPREELTALANWNFKVLSATPTAIHQQTAKEFLKSQVDTLDWIYLDPSRRSTHTRVIAMENYEPHLLKLWPELRAKAKQIMVKFSPMQDLSEIKRSLPGLEKIWVLSIKHELKEVLAVFGNTNPPATALSILDCRGEQWQMLWEGNLEDNSDGYKIAAPLAYIFEPAAGILKAGVQDLLAQGYGLSKLHPNSHLYTSDQLLESYPGKVFKYLAREKFQQKAIDKWIVNQQAHVIVRNFPTGAEAIKKKLKLKEQGNRYLLATTIAKNEKVILITDRIR